MLDVGCNAGFYSFELARRGASVLAIDMRSSSTWTQARWAARAFGLQDRVEFRQHGGLRNRAARSEQFDLVWFMGVFYHLRYPLLALDLLARRTRRLMVFQTLTMPGDRCTRTPRDHPITEREPLLDPGWPKMAFIEHRFSGDPTNWWVANHAGVEAMLRSSGLRICSGRRTRSTSASPTRRAMRAQETGHDGTGHALDALRVAAAVVGGPAMTDRAMLAVCAGRFVLPNATNLALVRQALASAPRCLVFIRRAHMAPSPANPFDADARATMLHDGLTEDERLRTEFVPLRERWDDQRLLRDMGVATAGQHRVTWVVAGPPPVDAEDLPTGWSLQPAADGDGDAQAVAWLEQLYAGEDPARGLAALHDGVPEGTLAFLRQWLGTRPSPPCATIGARSRTRSGNGRWRPIRRLVTVDAVVHAGGHVLLIRRGRPPGRGLWALPGGFLEPREPVMLAALRELVEETGLPLSVRQLKHCLKGMQVFDHPERSQRGRIITHTWFFDLGDMAPPPVQAGDDAAAAQWVRVAELPSLETQLHDDHFHMLDTFLALPVQGA